MQYHSSTIEPVSAAFVSDLREFAYALVGVPHTDNEGDFLQDVGRGRYPMKALLQLMSIASRSPNVAHHETLAELVRRSCQPRNQPSSINAVGEAELRAQGPHDLAWRAFEISQCRSTREIARQTGRAHFATLRAQLDYLERWGVQ